MNNVLGIWLELLVNQIVMWFLTHPVILVGLVLWLGASSAALLLTYFIGNWLNRWRTARFERHWKAYVALMNKQSGH